MKKILILFLVLFMTSACDIDIMTDEKQACVFEDLAQVFDLMGKSAKEAGIDEKYLDDTGFSIKGKLFGAEAEGSITFDLRDHSDKILHHALIFIDEVNLSFQDCLKHLEEEYGEAFDQGEEPYVEANGGAVEWYRFYTGKGEIHISKGEKHDFYTIRYENSAPPQ